MLKKAAHSNPNMVRQQWISGADEALEAALRGPCLGNGAFWPLGWREGFLRAFWLTRFLRRWVRNGPARRSKGRRTTRTTRRTHSHFHRSTACLRSCFLWTNGNSRTASELGNEREQWNWAKERTVFFWLSPKSRIKHKAYVDLDHVLAPVEVDNLIYDPNLLKIFDTVG